MSGDPTESGAGRAESSGGGFPAPLVLGGLIGFILVAALANSGGERSGVIREDPAGPASRPISLPAGEWQADLKEAEAASRDGDFTRALDLYKKAHKAAPDIAATNGELGRHYMTMQQFEKARPYLARARELDSKNPGLARIFGFCLLRLDRKAEGLGELAEACRLAPNDKGMLLSAGRLALDAGEPKTAATYLQLLLKLDKTHADALETLALAFRSMGRADEAVAALTDLVEAHPERSEAWTALVSAALETGGGRALLKRLRATPVEQRSVGMSRAIGRLCCSWPDTVAEARGELVSALKTHPGDASLELDLSAVDYRLGRYDDAIKQLDGVLAGGPELPLRIKALSVLGLVRRARGETDAALVCYRKLIELKVGDGFLGEISALREAGRVEVALRKLGQVQKRFPKRLESVAALFRAQILEEAGEVDLAMAAYRTALEMPNQSDAHIGLARLLIMKGQPAEAARQLSTAIPRPDGPQLGLVERALLWRALAWTLADKPEKARADLERAAAGERDHLPFVTWRALAKHWLGQLDRAGVEAMARGHNQGPFLDNDKLFFLAMVQRHEAKDEAAARALLEEARAAAVGHESPARLVEVLLDPSAKSHTEKREMEKRETGTKERAVTEPEKGESGE